MAPLPRRLLLPVVAAALRAAAAQYVPMPSRTSCPECAFGTWSCPATKCNASQQLPGLVTNFTYAVGQCWEDVPVDGRTMRANLDVHCSFGEDIGLNCDNMTMFRFDGLAILEQCSPTTKTAADLVLEECEWECKFKRPVARCQWSFDRAGAFTTTVGGTLERCWLLGRCSVPSGGTTGAMEVDVVCKPIALWATANNTASTLAKARETLAEARLSANATRLEAEAAWLSQVVAPLRVGVFSAEDTAEARALRQQVAMQLAALVSELRRASPGLEANTSAAVAVDQALDDAVAAYSKVSQVLDAYQQIAELNSSKASLLATVAGIQKQLDESARQAEDLEDDKNSAVVAAVVSGVVLCCVVALGVLLATRYKAKVSALLHRRAGEGAVAADGGTLVVGRPVGEQRPSPEAKVAWPVDAEPKGGPRKGGGDYEAEPSAACSGLRACGNAGAPRSGKKLP